MAKAPPVLALGVVASLIVLGASRMSYDTQTLLIFAIAAFVLLFIYPLTLEVGRTALKLWYSHRFNPFRMASLLNKVDQWLNEYSTIPRDDTHFCIDASLESANEIYSRLESLNLPVPELQFTSASGEIESKNDAFNRAHSYLKLFRNLSKKGLACEHIERLKGQCRVQGQIDTFNRMRGRLD